MSSKNESKNDCLECRIVGGICISIIGAYLWSQAKRRNGLERVGIQILSCGTLGLGIARFFNVIPWLTKTDEKD